VVEYVVRGRVDDALDVFGVHGIGGLLGALLVGVFATKAVNPAGADGLLLGNFKQLGVQALTVGVVALYSAGMTWGILKVIDLVIGLRVSKSDEQLGLDTTQHGEVAYRMGS
jgi:ammonium transporter, Amt family